MALFVPGGRRAVTRGAVPASGAPASRQAPFPSSASTALHGQEGTEASPKAIRLWKQDQHLDLAPGADTGSSQAFFWSRGTNTSP